MVAKYVSLSVAIAVLALASIHTSLSAGNAMEVNPSPVEYDFPALFQPVPATARFSDPEYNIWCGSAVRGDDGKYHLYYSRWPRSLTHAAWVTHSEVAHAVSDSPLGPWRHLDVALPARGTNFWDGSCTHNPTVIRSRGIYYLYYMGNYGDGVVEQPLNWIHRNHQRIGVAVAENPGGPWRRMDRPLIDVSADTNAPDALCVANPSVTQRPDGGFLMVYKGVAMKGKLPFGGPVVHLVATSESPTGPFKKYSQPIFTKPGERFAAEDPFIWSEAGKYWAIVKDFNGIFTGKGYSLALFESANGFDWHTAKHTLVTTPQVTWADGHTQKLVALERPQLVFDQGKPVALLCAGVDNSNRVGSFNVGIPLKSAEPNAVP